MILKSYRCKPGSLSRTSAKRNISSRIMDQIKILLEENMKIVSDRPHFLIIIVRAFKSFVLKRLYSREL